MPVPAVVEQGTQFTCFTGQKTNTDADVGGARRHPLHLQILTQMWEGAGARYPLSLTAGNLRSKDGTVYTMPESRY